MNDAHSSPAGAPTPSSPSVALKRPTDAQSLDHETRKRLKTAANGTSFAGSQTPTIHTSAPHPPAIHSIPPLSTASSHTPSAAHSIPHGAPAVGQMTQQASSATSSVNKTAQQHVRESAAALADDTVLNDPEGYMKGLLLPTLNHVSMSVIEYVTRCSVRQLLEMYENPSSRARRALDHLHSIFLRTRDNFMDSGKFLDVASADRISSVLSPEEARQAFRNTNMASVICVILLPTYYTMKDLSNRLATVFEPLDYFLRGEMDLVIGFLTQVQQIQMIEASKRRIAASDEPLSRVVETYLVNSVQDDAARTAFWQKCQDLRSFLMSSSLNDLVAADCRGSFLRDFRRYLQDYLHPPAVDTEYGTAMPEETALLNTDLPIAMPAFDNDGEDGEEFDMASSILNAAKLAQSFMKGPPKGEENRMAGTNGSATRAGNDGPIFLSDPSQTVTSGGLPPHYEYQHDHHHHHQSIVASNAEADPTKSAVSGTAHALAPAVVRTEDGLDGVLPTLHAQQPWTKEEENALMEGLDTVQGPDWAKILAMFGVAGSRSDVLKDRSPVQLDDKARKIKLFFQKQGYAVPPCLQGVAGDEQQDHAVDSNQPDFYLSEGFMRELEETRQNGAR